MNGQKLTDIRRFNLNIIRSVIKFICYLVLMYLIRMLLFRYDTKLTGLGKIFSGVARAISELIRGSYI